MCGSCGRYVSISRFTLSLLEDTGWYQVDYAAAEFLHSYELLWGRGALIYQSIQLIRLI